MLEVLGEDEWSFSYGLRRAVLRVGLLWGGLWTVWVLGFAVMGLASLQEVILAPLAALTVPANPQGRGDYYLRAADGRTYCA